MKSLFDNTTLGKQQLKNRFIRSATWEALTDFHGHINDELQKMYINLAKGGVGTIITGATTVDASDRLAHGMMGLYDDSFINEYKGLIEKIHQYDTKIWVQIGLGGYNAHSGQVLPNKDVELSSQKDIKQTISDFANAAIRAKKAGFDGVQIHAAHGFLLSRFLSSHYNNRTDEYGGCINNRARIIFEIYNAIRTATGNDFCITIKINCSDFIPGGLTENESLYVCQKLSEMGIDTIEVSGNGTSRSGIRTSADEAYFKEFAIELAQTVTTPIILVGGHRSVENMSALLNNTKIEYFALSRPLIRQPDIINQWKLGDSSPATCTSCNRCYSTNGHYCIYNIKQ